MDHGVYSSDMTVDKSQLHCVSKKFTPMTWKSI